MGLSLSSQVLQRRVFKKKFYKLHVKDFMLGQTTRWLSKDKNSIDVGGATGIYSTHFCKHSNQVYAFEAVPPVHKQLYKLTEQFNNFICQQAAVSNFEGTSEFYVDDKRLSNSGLQNLVDGQKIQVPVVTIDSFNYKDVGFIKVDTEGTELDVLQGAINTIDKYLPTCMIECYYKFNKYPIETTYNFFKERNYNCAYNEKGKGLVEVKSVDEFIQASTSDEMLHVHDGDFIFYQGNIPT